jgi:hypothetical protein
LLPLALLFIPVATLALTHWQKLEKLLECIPSRTTTVSVSWRSCS